ncbi:MAG: PAS domain S-box protein, partial [Myxococcales bacterium]|nr:PAS domain S-box protein [Myxococcales bacterium]
LRGGHDVLARARHLRRLQRTERALCGHRGLRCRWGAASRRYRRAGADGLRGLVRAGRPRGAGSYQSVGRLWLRGPCPVWFWDRRRSARGVARRSAPAPGVSRQVTDAERITALVNEVAVLAAENAALREAAERDRDNERFLESIVEYIPDMIFVKDAQELRFVRFNAAGEALLGFPRADLLGKSDRDFFPHEEADFFLNKDRQVLAAGGVLDIPEEPIHTTRGVRYLHTKKIPIHGDDGKPRFLLGISEDITERKLSEEHLARRTRELASANADLLRVDRDLRYSHARLRALLEHFPGVMWTTDAEFHFTSTAGALAEAVGLAPDRVIGEPVEAWLQPAGPGQDVMALHRLALQGQPQGYEFRALNRTFEVRLCWLGESPAEGLIGVGLDVTERRRDEAERFEQRLERAQKLEMLGLLAGGIAHDFNNLLTVILGNASLALLRMSGHSPARVPVERVQSSAQTAADLTRQLLAYSGKGRFVVEPVDLSAVVREMGMLFKVSVGTQASLKFNLAANLPLCEADGSQIRQILINLITNASDALGGGPGNITLTTGTVDADREYLSRAWLDESLPPGPYVWVEVCDTGAGMAPDTQNHMFDPFFTTKDKGHGLGLSATLGIVRGHRGAIRVYSELGVGTTIRILFPGSGPGHRAEVAAPEPRVGSGPLGRILVVDDEQAIRTFASDVLTGLGFLVLTAADGVEALQVIGAHSGQVDAVLLDMTMPRMGGEEAFREMRKVKPDIRVLLSSGYNEQDATSRFAGRGLAGFLQKPYTAQELAERVIALFRPVA